ncbi:MAG: DUF3892 domain-containing protein [Bacteroidota bacterium]|nr:DUF3892 domain-containing protein [Bacteroidota bacterium]
MRIQIQCINKSDRFNAHERIKNCGGLNNTIRWKKSQPDIVYEIESNINQYYVKVNGYREVNVIIAKSAAGNKYIKTTEDGEMPNNLLSLPECP